MRKHVLKYLIPSAGVPLAVALLLLLSQKQPAAPTDTPQQTTNVSPTTHTAAPYAVVGDFEGRLAIFRGDTQNPSEVLDVYIASLPESEQAALKNGVAAQNEIELQRLLEDYTG